MRFIAYLDTSERGAGTRLVRDLKGVGLNRRQRTSGVFQDLERLITYPHRCSESSSRLGVGGMLTSVLERGDDLEVLDTGDLLGSYSP